MNVPLSKEAHIAIRYAIMHAFEGNINPDKIDYVIQRAARCPVCSGEGTPYGVESPHMQETDPGDHLFHHVCSNCFAQIVLCTDYVTFTNINIGYTNTTTGALEFFCTENQFPKRSEFYIRGRECDKDDYLNYVAQIREHALKHRDRSIADSEKYFSVEVDIEPKQNFPLN